MKISSSAACLWTCFLGFASASLLPAQQLAVDLAPVSLQASNTLDAGQTVSLSWVAKNLGKASARPAWNDRVYLSTDAVLSARDAVLGQGQWLESVGAGSNYQASLKTSIPEVAPGNYYLILKIDVDDQVPETSETNNVLARAVRIRAPDLEPKLLQGPEVADVGQSITINWQALNRGDTVAGTAWYDRIYLSVDAVLGAGDSPLGQTQQTRPVGTGSNYTASLVCTLPETAPGSYYLILNLDAYNDLFESSETNNVLTQAFRLRVPDLVPISLRSPTTVTQGVAFQVECLVTNVGTAQAKAPWGDKIYLSANNSYDSTDLELAQMRQAASVPARSQYSFKADLRISDLADGSYFLLLAADAERNVYELSETNNLLAFPIRLIQEQPQIPASCCEGKQWLERTGKPPSPRFGHSMAGDTARAQVVLFGGNDGVIKGDTWVWNGGDWQQKVVSGPGAREFSAMAYDAGRGRTVLFGGRGTNGAWSDTWEWDGAAWVDKKLTGPSPRYYHAMAYDALRKRVVLYGGFYPAQERELDDTWEYDGSKWVQINAAEPGPRVAHAMAWDGQNVILFGGQGKGVVNGDTWRWLGEKWVLVATNGPSPRRHHAMAYDDACERVVLFGGGTSAAAVKDDTWEWSRGSWTQVVGPAPPARWQHALAHCTPLRHTVLFGGYRSVTGALGHLGDTWIRTTEATPPRLLSIEALCGDNQIIITFNEPVDPNTATNPANYQLICGSVKIIQVALSPDQQVVNLTTDQPLPASTSCTLVVLQVTDLCGNRITGEQRSFSCAPDPCPRGSSGREFWLTFPGNYAPDLTNMPQPRLFITGTVGTSGTVSAPGLNPPFAQNFAIPAGGVVVVNLPRAADLEDANDQIENKGVHVIASSKVSVYGYNRALYTTDAYMALAVPALGRSYMVLSYENVFRAVPELSGVQFAIVAAEDDTLVTISPSAHVGGHPAHVPYQVALMKGQTYQLRHTNDAPVDLTGTIIVADRPIGAYGSHRCANIPNREVFFCDHIVEQLLPAELWGRNFVAMPLKTRTGGDTFRILGLNHGTTVQINGVAVPDALDRGHIFEFIFDTPTHIASSRPVLVAQYANSSDFDHVENSDPFMVLIPPTTLYSSSYVVHTPYFGFGDNYLNVTVPASSVGQIRLDGAVIPAASFVPIAASGYAGAQVSVGVGPHVLQSLKREPFGLIVYGWNQYDSYGYPGAACDSGEGSTPPRFICPPTNTVVAAGADCTAIVPDLASQVGNGGQAVLILQEPPAGAEVGPGTYQVTLTIIDAWGERKLCPVTLTVNSPSGAGLRCPANLTTNCLKGEGVAVMFSASVCNKNYTVTSDPPSGSVFPVGITTVTCTARSAAGATEKCTFTVTVRCSNLVIDREGEAYTVNFPEGGTLSMATNVLGPYVPLPDATSPYRPAIRSKAQAFFRWQAKP